MNLTPEFRKSSYSNQSQNCVEVADLPGLHLVRDTQNRDAGHLTVPAEEWKAALSAIRAQG